MSNSTSENKESITYYYHKSPDSSSSDNNNVKSKIADLHLPLKLSENELNTQLFPSQPTINIPVPTKSKCLSRARKYYMIIISLLCLVTFFLVLFLIP